MTEKPLVSAVIPVRNGERFISDAIASVLDQSYEQVECVVVDDGSTDSTARVVEGFGKRVRLIRKQAQGVSGARNTGVDQSRGRYVAFLDADDLWLPRKTQLQIELLERRPDVVMVNCGMHVVDEELNFIGRVDPPSADQLLRGTLLLEGSQVSVSSTGVVRRAAFIAEGGFDESLSTSADCDLTCRLTTKYQADVVKKPLVLYRMHPMQMHKSPERTYRDVSLVYEKLFKGYLPAELQKLRRRAEANLHVSVAGAYLMQGRRVAAVRHAVRASLLRPDRVLHALHRLTTPAAGLKRAQ